MRMSHTEARRYVIPAFTAVIGRPGNLTEYQLLQAIAVLETGYGSSWKPPGDGSFNMGAIQVSKSWTGSFFEYTDTHPNKDGTSTPYNIGFRKYSSPQAGFEDLVKSVYLAFDRRSRVLPAATRGDALAFSTELHRAPCYYEGFGATDAERIAHHHAAVMSAVTAMAAELNEPMPGAPRDGFTIPVIAPALFIGCKGVAVERWQAIVGVKVDGDFGGATQVATRAWQAAHGLPASGIVVREDLVTAGLIVDRDTDLSELSPESEKTT